MAMLILVALFVVGWVAVALVGTQAYFLGEQSKPIHERNWDSDSFEAIALSITGAEVDYSIRIPGYRA
jgi:biopolymer transport protein ExbB/TolQ